jgi:hypothetical protein
VNLASSNAVSTLKMPFVNIYGILRYLPVQRSSGLASREN